MGKIRTYTKEQGNATLSLDSTPAAQLEQAGTGRKGKLPREVRPYAFSYWNIVFHLLQPAMS